MANSQFVGGSRSSSELEDKQGSKSTTAKLLAELPGTKLKEMLDAATLAAYAHLPASLTGRRTDPIPHILSDPMFGAFPQLQRDRGHGAWPALTYTTRVALEDDSGMSSFRMNHERIVTVTRPDDLRQVFSFGNEDKTSRAEAFIGIDYLFGHDNLLTMESGAAHKSKRLSALATLFTQTALKKLLSKMMNVIRPQITANVKAGQTIDADQVFTPLTSDVFSQSVFGTRPIDEKGLGEISDAFQEAFDSSLDFWNVTKAKVSRGIKKLTGYEPKFSSIEEPKAHLNEVLKKYIIDPNKDRILDPKNESLLLELAKLQRLKKFEELKKLGKIPTEAKIESLPLELDTPQMQADIAMFLFEGHITTSKLIKHVFVLLANHPEVMEKLQNNLEKHREAWSQGHTPPDDYLLWVLNETLRLYPSVGVSVRKVMEPYTIGRIPACSSKKEYDEAMAARDKSKDVHLTTNDYVLVAPSITQRCDRFFHEADKFKPERFNPQLKPDDELYMEDKEFGSLPFSAGERKCPGQRFALMEAAFTIIETLDVMKKNNLTLQVNQSHPLDVYDHGVLETVKPVKITFVPKHELQKGAKQEDEKVEEHLHRRTSSFSR